MPELANLPNIVKSLLMVYEQTGFMATAKQLIDGGVTKSTAYRTVSLLRQAVSLSGKEQSHNLESSPNSGKVVPIVGTPLKEKSPHTPLKENNNIIRARTHAREERKKMEDALTCRYDDSQPDDYEVLFGVAKLHGHARREWEKKYEDPEILDLALLEFSLKPNSMETIEHQLRSHLARTLRFDKNFKSRADKSKQSSKSNGHVIYDDYESMYNEAIQ